MKVLLLMMFKSLVLYMIIILNKNIVIINCLTAIEEMEDTRRTKETLLLFKMYPKAVLHFPVRKDSNNEEVSRGRLEILNYHNSKESNYHNKKDNNNNDNKVSLEKFKEIMQCDDNEPALDQYYGTLSLMLLFPPSKETVELMCAWAETRCVDWVQCKAQVNKFKRGNFYYKL